MCLPRHVEKTDKIFRLQRKYLRVTENIQVTETTFKSQKKTFDPRNVCELKIFVCLEIKKYLMPGWGGGQRAVQLPALQHGRGRDHRLRHQR